MKKSRKKARSPEFEKQTIYRDAGGRFATKTDKVSTEHWTFRRDAKTKQIRDLKISGQPFGAENTMFLRSIQIPEDGARAGKIYPVLRKVMKFIPVMNHDSLIEITMTAKTSKGKIVKRKMSFYHYNSKKISERTVSEIVNTLFYQYGERPTYPVQIVNWGTKEKRQTSMSATKKRRQLHDVTFSIKSSVETRKQGEMKKRRKKK